MKSLKNNFEDNMGGNVRLFLADISEITSFPFVNNAFVGNITFTLGKGFYQFDCSQQSIDAKVIPDGSFFKHSLTCQVPIVSIERDQILDGWSNTPFIILRKDTNGNFFVHGHINYPIYLINWQRIENGSFTSLKGYQLDFGSKPVIPLSAIPYNGVVTIQY
jgi:hypothetical protein